MNVERMRRYVNLRWHGLPKTRTFTHAEIEQEQAALQGWPRLKFSEAPITNWVLMVRRHNPQPTTVKVVENAADLSLTMTIAAAR